MGEFEISTYSETVASSVGWRKFFLVGVVAFLLAIWPLPNSIALRQLLLLGGVLVAVSVLPSEVACLDNRKNWSIWLFFSFFLWLLFHFFLLPTNTGEQLYELRGDWLRAFLASLIGLAVGLLFSKQGNDRRNLAMESTFIAGLSGTIVIYVARYAWEVLQTGQWIHKDFYMEPYLGKTPMVVFGSVFLCGLFARLSNDLSPREKSVWNAISLLAIFLVGITYYFSNTKNGFLVFIFIFLVYTWRLLRNHARSRTSDKLIFLLVLIVLIGFLKTHINSNPSWLNFYADVKAGNDIENNQNWKNADMYPLPVNGNGQTANGSTYERSAWATAGSILVREHPLGYGLINHSFGALALQKWDDFYKPVGKYRHASHSGWLDFTLGFGIPGLILVLLPMWVSFFRAANRIGFWFEFVRWSVPVVTIVFTITEVCTGHFIEFLFFYVALTSGITVNKKKT